MTYLPWPCLHSVCDYVITWRHAGRQPSVSNNVTGRHDGLVGRREVSRQSAEWQGMRKTPAENNYMDARRQQRPTVTGPGRRGAPLHVKQHKYEQHTHTHTHTFTVFDLDDAPHCCRQTMDRSNQSTRYITAPRRRCRVAETSDKHSFMHLYSTGTLQNLQCLVYR